VIVIIATILAQERPRRTEAFAFYGIAASPSKLQINTHIVSNSIYVEAGRVAPGEIGNVPDPQVI